ncbi:MAG: hypothetical protein HFI34_06030 [Lachnospiraceae bacterium]|nr:hypothetical protein [Lachnospiraceae bacterium]
MRKKIFGIAVLVLLALTILSAIFKTSVKNDTSIEYTQKKAVGYVEKDTEIEYVFTPQEDIVGIKLLIGTYGKKITRGKLIIRIYDYESDELLVKTDIESENLRDNQFAYADTGKLQTKNRKLKVLITGREFWRSKGVTLWLGENSLDEYSVTKVDELRQKDELIITTSYLVKDTPYTWELLLLTAVCFLVFIMQWDGGRDEQEENN